MCTLSCYKINKSDVFFFSRKLSFYSYKRCSILHRRADFKLCDIAHKQKRVYNTFYFGIEMELTTGKWLFVFLFIAIREIGELQIYHDL